MLREMNSASSSVSQSQGNDDGTAEQRNKDLESDEEPEDRISALPDFLIHRILSFLPSTQDAIKTCILSKRWKCQWTHVPDLCFDSTGLTTKTFSTLIENTLARFECSTIETFCIRSSCDLTAVNPLLPLWIQFATRREVQELILNFSGHSYSNWRLPQFLFDNDSLIYLATCNWVFRCSGKVNWPSLKSLHICTSVLPDGTIENVMSGCPLLESLELIDCYEFKQLVIASTSLKSLLLKDIAERYYSELEVSCPNLEELELVGKLFFRSFKLLNLPSSICATLDFVACEAGGERAFVESSAVEILMQIHGAKELNMGAWLTKVLSELEVVRGLCCPLLHIKCLTFDVYGFQNCLLGIACFFRNSPVLEKLVIKLRKEPVRAATFVTSDLCEKWNSNRNVLDCSPLHLKRVEIVGLNEKCYQYQHVFGFIEFILRTARVLEKMVIFQDRGCRLDFAFHLSKFLLSIRRCSPYVTVDMPWSVVRDRQRCENNRRITQLGQCTRRCQVIILE